METNDIIDPFRESNPQLKRYTWRRRNPLKQARLDFFLTSESMSQYIKVSKIGASGRSDHSLVTLELNFTSISHGNISTGNIITLC